MAATEGETFLCLVRVGELKLLIDPAEVHTIEGVLREDRAAVAEVDLRDGLRVATRAARAESLLVQKGRLRLVVCGVEQILRNTLTEIFPLPHVLVRYGRKLGLRGLVVLGDELAYLAAPVDLGRALLAASAA